MIGAHLNYFSFILDQLGHLCLPGYGSTLCYRWEWAEEPSAAFYEEWTASRRRSADPGVEDKKRKVPGVMQFLKVFSRGVVCPMKYFECVCMVCSTPSKMIQGLGINLSRRL